MSLTYTALEQRVKHWFSVRGSIGAGKSSVIDAIVSVLQRRQLMAVSGETGERPRYVSVDEPIGPWTEKRYLVPTATVASQEQQPEAATAQSSSPECDMAISTDELQKPLEKRSLLDLFYSDLAQYAYPFQITAFTSRIDGTCEAVERYEGDLRLLSDRDLGDDIMFFDMLNEAGLVKPWEYDSYKGLYKRTALPMYKHVSVVLYVPTSPERCFERIQRRGREGEADRVTLAYLQQLHRAHMASLAQFTGRIIVLDEFAQDLTPEEMMACAERVVDQMEAL